MKTLALLFTHSGFILGMARLSWFSKCPVERDCVRVLKPIIFHQNVV